MRQEVLDWGHGCCLPFLLLQSHSITTPSLRAPHLRIGVFVSVILFKKKIYIYVAACKIKIHMLEYAYSCTCSSAYVSA